MKIEDKIYKQMKGVLNIKTVDAATGEILGEEEECNIIVLDSRESITRCVSGSATSYTIDTLKLGSDLGERITGTPNITFANDNPDTIVRDSGSWITDGFAATDAITVGDSTFNDGEYTIDSLDATTLTLDVGDALTNEGPSSGISVSTGTVDTPATPLNTYDETTMDVLYTVPDALTVGYPDTQSVSFNVTVDGADFMTYYPLETSKIFNSAALYVSGGQVFSYKRFTKKSISPLVNIVIAWTLTY